MARRKPAKSSRLSFASAGPSSVNADRTLARDGWLDYVFSFHDNEEIGPRMLARIAKHTGLKPEDL